MLFRSDDKATPPVDSFKKLCLNLRIEISKMSMNNNTKKINRSKEKERLRVLKEYNILESDFDFVYILESLLEICNVPFCSISSIFKDDYHVIASAGFDTPTVFPRKGSCTEYIYRMDEFCESDNVQEEEAISDSGKLLNGSKIIFYAGIPIYDTNGFTQIGRASCRERV